MSDTDKKEDEKKGDEVLKRMLKTPPKPDNETLTKSRQTRKPSDPSAKKSRSEKS